MFTCHWLVKVLKFLIFAKNFVTHSNTPTTEPMTSFMTCPLEQRVSFATPSNCYVHICRLNKSKQRSPLFLIVFWGKKLIERQQWKFYSFKVLYYNENILIWSPHFIPSCITPFLLTSDFGTSCSMFMIRYSAKAAKFCSIIFRINTI